MSFIRTILGDLPPAEMGPCYAHEHLIIDPSYATSVEPDFLLDEVDRCSVELKKCFDLGVRTMVDSMPMACGRNAAKLAEVSRRSGIQIVCPTGIHLRKYYPPGHWIERMDSASLANRFIREIDEGINDSDQQEPSAATPPGRAGVIKVASSLNRIGDEEKKVFEAAAEAHRATGAPILTHTEQGTAALEQVRFFAERGVGLNHVVLSHLDRKPDLAYQREVLSTGVNIEYDSAFRWKTPGENPTLRLLMALLAEFPDQIVLGMDAARRSYWESYGGKPGMTFLYAEWTQQMRAAGITQDAIDRMFVTTPAAAYSFSGGNS